MTYKAACKLASNKKSISCTVFLELETQEVHRHGPPGRAEPPGTVSKGSKSRKATLTLKSSKALKKGQKVVLKITSGKTTKVLTVKAS